MKRPRTALPPSAPSVPPSASPSRTSSGGSALLSLSPRRFFFLALLLLVIALSILTTRPSVKRHLVRWLSHSHRRIRSHTRQRAVSDAPAAPTPEPLTSDGLPVPDVVHFVFGLEPTFGHIKFGLLHYLAVLGAAMHIRPALIKWHYRYLPEGVWWECARSALTLHRVEDVTHVHGKPKAMRVQHKADILRMQIMIREGGMYVDSDVIPLKSFQELRRYPLVMGQEADNGLCNAVMIGQPNTTFINRWWAEYVHFEPDKQWAYHSVLLPRALHAAHPGEVLVLSDKAFFYPLWTQLTAMYDSDDGYDYVDNFAVHLWTSADPGHRERLSRLSMDDLFFGNGSFHRVARTLVREAEARGALCGYASAQSCRYPHAARELFRQQGVMAGLALRRLPRELERFVSNPIPGCELSVVGGELRSLPVILKVAVDKPAILEGTVYAGERFELTITCDDGYPFAAPQFKVSSRHIPLHTHIYSNGFICLEALYAGRTGGWTPATNIHACVLAILVMLAGSNASHKRRDESDAYHSATHPHGSDPRKVEWAFHDILQAGSGASGDAAGGPGGR